MPIHRFLKELAFDQDAITAMAAAFEHTLRELNLTDRDDAIVETVARIIIECAQQGHPAALNPTSCREHLNGAAWSRLWPT